MKYANNKKGIVVVNKPAGCTSRDVVAEVQKTFNTKAGHTGTLDPMAQGVLVVCLGKYTKLTDVLTSTIKEYIADVTLGIETDTLDTEGTIIKKGNAVVSKEDIEKALINFKTTYEQEVPKYSAVKVAGRKLYEYARKNEEVMLPKKPVTIYDLDLLDYKIIEDKTIFKIHCTVSKGTYIRSLIRDISYSLKTYGIMSDLIRIKQGKFTLNDAYTLEDIKKGDYQLLDVKDVLDLPVVVVTEEEKNKISNGQKLPGDYEKVLFVDKEGTELAIYQRDNDELRMWKMLYESNR